MRDGEGEGRENELGGDDEEEGTRGKEERDMEEG